MARRGSRKRLDPPVDATGQDLSPPFCRMALMTKRLSALLCHTLDYVCAGLRRLAAQGHKFLPSRRITPRLRLLRAVVDANDNPLRRITFERDNLSPSNETSHRTAALSQAPTEHQRPGT